MRKRALLLAAACGLGLHGAEAQQLNLGPGPVMGVPQIQASNLCLVRLWNQTAAFKDLPHAAFSVFPWKIDPGQKTYWSYWVVDWDHIKAGGSCEVVFADGKPSLKTFEQDFEKKK